MDPLFWAKALGLLKRFWYVVPIAALAVALFLTRGTLADTKADRDAWKTQTTRLEERNKTTQSSLDGALGKINEQNKTILAGEQRLQEDRTRAAADEAALSARYKTTAARVTALEASAKAKPLDPCKPSAVAVDALKDL